MTKKLVLFDVDHTLLDVKRIHYKVFAVAFKEIFDIDLDHTALKYDGYTDLQVIYELMDMNKIEKNLSSAEKIIDSMIKEFKPCISRFI